MLNPQQLAAVRHTHSPLLVLAGAGCGKTRVITEKIQHLISRQGLAPERIYAITFTNKAAREMRHRVAAQIKQAKDLNILTFHALGLKILQMEIQHTAYRPGFSILDSSETHKLMQGLMPKGLNKALIAQFQWQISHWKNQGIEPTEATHSMPLAVECYQAYSEHLRDLNAMDFDDLIGQPLKLFQRNRAVLHAWQQRVGHLLVDEYQDTNACQYRLMQLLVGLKPGLTCVGDDDQSIYGWRGAQPENLQLLQRDFAGLEVILLEQNYRSSQTILAAANEVIRNNPHPFEKKIWSELGRGDAIAIQAFEDAESEARQVAADIDYKRVLLRARHGDFAVLYRSNHQARIFEQVFRANNIPYRISGGRSLFDHSEIRDIMAYLRLMTNPRDDSALLRIINVPRRGIGAQTLKQLALQARQFNLGLFAAMQHRSVLETLGPQAATRLTALADLIHKHRALRDNAGAALKQLLDAVDYSGWVKASADNEKSRGNKLNMVQHFMRWVVDFSSEKNLSAVELLNHLALQNSPDDDAADNESVSLMTLHSAKGLEFPHVYLVGAEEGILPHRNSIESDDIDEERRLMYVGMTRAMRRLNISYVKKRKNRFADDERPIHGPSRFLDEIPARFVAGGATGESSPADSKKHLAALRSLLKKPSS